MIETLIAAIILMGLVVVLLAIGKLITGKNKLRKGCGMTPVDRKKKNSTCSICGATKTCEREKNDDDSTSGDSGENRERRET